MRVEEERLHSRTFLLFCRWAALAINSYPWLKGAALGVCVSPQRASAADGTAQRYQGLTGYESPLK